MEVLTSLESAVGSASSDPGSADVVTPPVALCGRVVNAVVWEEGLWDTVTSSGVGVGSFVRLRNVGNAGSGPIVSLGSTNCEFAARSVLCRFLFYLDGLSRSLKTHVLQAYPSTPSPR